ncbi:hypothetical protein IW146_007229 [Coemansia sp. RSA 922]|nr:hypothetical protein GGI14_002988 [Coemansia sp. S680]KAJ2042692.1 hypothetical protein H4S04_007161 [Coemansia sp. S16]KAJ2105575.1 hypothetical protein GGI16_002299 [Coemansia sp. S142-1]KAJ2107616.1 hypothetical protein IW146_007229 [Coemansia sp. RSA 922]
MSLFRNSSAQSTVIDSQFRRVGGSSAPIAATRSTDTDFVSVSGADPTYYDVLKCHGEFSTPSPFFSRQLKAVHGGSSMYPWAVQSTDVLASSVVGSNMDAKHRLRRPVASGASDLTSHGGSIVSSSAFPQGHSDGSLPSSVFRLPTSRGGERSSSAEPWALTGMTSGGRALRKANQVKMSVFDRKVTLV